MQGILFIHVDDFFHIRNENFEQKISQQLDQTFKIGKHAHTTFKYLI